MEVFPERVRRLWNEWELRAMVLLSLTLQIILIIFGNRRKYITKTWVRVLVWSAYLMADWAATVALGALSNAVGDNTDNDSLDHNNELVAFWAPFLLLHLGGPDTITAYSLEDNELWLRHLLGLVVQVGVAFYIFLMSWKGAPLSFLAIPVFVAGIIKYGERTWALRSASRDQFRDSMLSPPDPGPDYAKFMEEYTGQRIFYEAVPGTRGFSSWDDMDIIPDSNLILASHCLFENFKGLFVDLILGMKVILEGRLFFKDSWSKAFKVVEVELGFVYDVLYTKATTIYTLLGCVLRIISFSATISVLVTFLILEKHGYLKINIIITYLLLGAAVVLEMYAVILLLSSDWAIIWLSKHKNNPVLTSIFRAIYFVGLFNKQRWSNSMAQCSLLRFCLKDKPLKFPRIQKLFWFDKLLEKHHYKTYVDVSDDLKELIFQHLLERLNFSVEPKLLCTHRGNWVLEKNNYRDLGWSIYVEFDRSILIWHIATDLCYYNSDPDTNIRSECQMMSKHLSDYMLYLLVKCPSMLPMGIGHIRFRDTCAEAVRFFQQRNSAVSDRNQACMMLLQVNTEIPPSDVKGDGSKSVLFDGCRLAKSLQMLETDTKWKIMSLVWVEMLSYAACHCRGIYHAQQLRRGGELLTHVWLLMAHHGATEQYQIAAGHAHAQLL